MQLPSVAHGRHVCPRSRPSEAGFIVLGLLLLVTFCLVVGVLVGKVIHQARYRHHVALGHREVRVVSGPVEVRYGAMVTARLSGEQEVWVRPLGNGVVAVFHGESSPVVVGFVDEARLRPRAWPDVMEAK